MPRQQSPKQEACARSCTSVPKADDSLAGAGWGPFKTAMHVFAALLGLGAVVCFSAALVVQRPFDATLAGMLAFLCWYVFSLLSERLRLKNQLEEDMKLGSVVSMDDDAAAPTSSDTVAVAILPEVESAVAKEGTLSKVLMHALAKEYLRCVSAVRHYQNVYGPLPEDLLGISGVSSLPSQAPPRPLLETSVASVGPPPSRADSLNQTSRTMNLGMELKEIMAAPTPRSPRGPPSPEEKRRRGVGVASPDCLRSPPVIAGESDSTRSAVAVAPPSPLCSGCVTDGGNNGAAAVSSADPPLHSPQPQEMDVEQYHPW